MSNLPEQTAWESGIHQLEEEDRAKAGPGGVLNIQATQLANRTRWLRAQVESVEDYREYTFYKSESDPDGTITGRANTPEGKIFRVAQGLNDDLAFIYYLNDSDTAVPLTALLGRGAITSTIRQFSTLELAENDVAAGNIPDGSTTYVRSTDDTALAVEYINNGGTLQATGRQMPSQQFVDKLAGNFFTALSVIDNAVNNCGLNIADAVKNYDLITNASEKRASEIYTAIAVVVNTLENLSILLDKNYTTIPSMNEDRLNLLMLSSRLLQILEGLDGFDPNAVLTRADIDEVGGGEYETIAGIFSYPEPTSLVTIDLTADKIPASKAEGDVNATAVITLDGSVFSSRCKISVQGASSASYPKKNLNLEFFDKTFDNNIELKIGGLRPHDTWVYKANWVDSTQCRNLMCYRLWQAFQASRSGYPKYDIDATYVGKKGMDGFPTGATAVPAGYPCVMHINGEFYGIGTFLIGKKRDNYNLKKDSPLQIQLDISQWILLNSMSTNYQDANLLEFKAPKTVTAETVAALSSWDAFAGAGITDFAAQVDKKLDKQNLIDFYLFVTFISAADLIHNSSDNLIKNVQLVTWNGTKWFFMPYDLDTVFGNNWAGGYSYKPAENLPWCVGSFWDNVRTVYGNDIAARYKELRDKKIISVDWVYDMSTHIQMRYPAGAYKNELAKWSVTTPALPYFSNNGRDQLVTWAKARIAAMDTYFNYAE
ncbi:CotH kinase family protein [Klebsiella pneumoniae]|uniref:CotH kinase family protein n=1 Tax=Klebsiella pneumoniae TaxID=573 RepID=UPI0010338FB8|nr:CotH kinase family protein [Klebsiella pneumoniae]